MGISDNYKRILDGIEKAAGRVGRNPSEVELLAVCKRQPLDRIEEAYASGVRLFGENRTQEADLHQSQIRHPDISWHYIGKLQKNKINKVLNSFDFIQSVDGVKALEHINKRVEVETDLFIEINIGEEPSKSGFTVEGLKKALSYISNLNRIRVTGLMTIPPFFQETERVRPFFTQMRELKEELNRMDLVNFNVKHLSMGMSDDYELAVEEGATMIRIGTALFGRRIQ
jgi:pyridoxal phosphate enzyme (YggS family)